MLGLRGGGFASAVKEESKKVQSTGKWEDFGRILAQTFGLASLRFWQIVSIIATCALWGYTWQAYRTTDYRFDGTDTYSAIRMALLMFALCIAAYVFVVVWGAMKRRALELEEYDDDTEEMKERDTERGTTLAALIIIESIALIAFYGMITPIIAWSIMVALVGFGTVPIGHFVFAGWLPIIITSVMLAVVPDFQVGRYAFRIELTNQPFGSSDKRVVDQTQVTLKEMDQDFEREKWDRGDQSAARADDLESELEETQAELTRLKTMSPRTRIVPQNHGKARALPSELSDLEYGEADKLALFISGWSTIGFSRERWTGNGITDTEWRKFTDILQHVGILNDKKRPMCSADEALNRLQLEPVDPPTPAKTPAGGSEQAQNRTQPTPTDSQGGAAQNNADLTPYEREALRKAVQALPESDKH